MDRRQFLQRIGFSMAAAVCGFGATEAVWSAEEKNVSPSRHRFVSFDSGAVTGTWSTGTISYLVNASNSVEVNITSSGSGYSSTSYVVTPL